MKEVIASFFIDRFWLAETCYTTELPFTKLRGVVIENKAIVRAINHTESSRIKMVFTGTVSDYSGIRLAIKCYLKLKKYTTLSSLVIMRQIHSKSLHEWLKKTALENNSIHLMIDRNPIPHSDVIRQIDRSNLGIISYQTNPVNKEKIPTKLYEYSRYKLPYLIQEGTHWEKKSRLLGGAVPIDFNNPDVEQILSGIKNTAELFPGKYPYKETWEYESGKIIKSINDLI